MAGTAQTAAVASPRSRARRWFARLIFSLVVLALAAYIGVSVLAASVLTVPRRIISAATPAALGLAFQDVRLLIIHGTADTLIPVARAEQIKVADPAAELWEVTGAGHAGLYAANPQAYVERVASFFTRSLQ